MIKNTLRSFGEYFLLLKRVFSKPDNLKIFAKRLVTEADKLVISSIPLVAVISIFIGAVLFIQTAYNLESPFIPKMYAGYMVRESLILEFSSTMVALILAGTMGSNIASELGTMRITELLVGLHSLDSGEIWYHSERFDTNVRFPLDYFTNMGSGEKRDRGLDP